MLSDNIKNYRKKSGMSQDELAEKLGVSRQSVSLWETGQTQPTIENIIALSKIFNISSDMLLGSSDNINISQDNTLADKALKRKTLLIITSVIAVTVIIGGVILAVFLSGNDSEQLSADDDVANNSVIQSENLSENSTSNENVSRNVNTNTSKVTNIGNVNSNHNTSKALTSQNANNSPSTSKASNSKKIPLKFPTVKVIPLVQATKSPLMLMNSLICFRIAKILQLKRAD